MPPLLPVVRMVAHMRGGQMMEDMIAIELAVIIVAMFAIAVGFDCIKDGMCDIGAVIHDIITATVRHYRQKKLIEQMEQEWENYLEKNRAKWSGI